jgi:tetratricopeptide (TPR) repeat protein
MYRSTFFLIAAVLLIAPRAVAQDIPESSPDAIAAHVEGLRAYKVGDCRAALPHFYRAHELDPTFYVPLFMGAVCSGGGGAGLAAVNDSLWGIVAENRSRFSDYYQRLIDIYVMRRSGGSWTESLELARSVAEAYPGTKANYNYAYWSVVNGRPNAALAALATLDPDREPMKGRLNYFDQKCNALHHVGSHDEELQCGRDAALRFPDHFRPHWLVARALAAQGRIDELAAVMEESLPEAPGWVFGNIGLELRARGHSEAAAKEYLEKAVAWYGELPPDQAEWPAMRRQQAYYFYATGRYDEARKAYEGIVADLGSVPTPKDFRAVAPGDRAYYGITSALAGDQPTAQRILDSFLAGEIQPTAPEEQHYYAALLSAALGDREGAAAHFEQTWARPETHRQPVLFLQMGDHPAFRAFVTPGR